jgi:glc operon protein GlcG
MLDNAALKGVDGQVVGAIGVSSDTPDHDEVIAKAGIAALSR